MGKGNSSNGIKLISLHFISSCPNILQSLLYNVYTKPQYFSEINTLSDLANTDLQISISSPVFKNLFGNNNTSDLVSSLNQKYHFSEGDFHHAMERAARHGDICCVERYSDIQLIIQVIFFNSTTTTIIA